MTQYEVILGTFNGAPEKAAPYVERLDNIKNDIKLVDVVAVTRTGDAKPEVDHRGASKGKAAGTGAVIGGLIGVLAGPGGVALGAAAGAAVGAALRGLNRYGVPKDILEKVETGLPENSSAVLVLMETGHAGAVVNELQDAGAEVIHRSVDRDQFDSAAAPDANYG